MLTVFLVKTINTLEEVHAIDDDFSALACTARNVFLARGSTDFGTKLRLFLINGLFDPAL
jgi:hypothetical protein